MNHDELQLRHQIAELVGQYADRYLAPSPFVPGSSTVAPSGKVIGGTELKSMMEAVLDGWLTTGRFNDAFEKKLDNYEADIKGRIEARYRQGINAEKPGVESDLQNARNEKSGAENDKTNARSNRDAAASRHSSAERCSEPNGRARIISR